MRVLLIEDDPITKVNIYSELFKEYYIVDHLAPSKFNCHIFSYDFFDAIIINVNAQALNKSICFKKIMKASNQTPILVLGEGNQKKECIQALDQGADSYVLKPYHLASLCAQLRCLTRRSSNLAPKAIKISNELEFVPENYSLNINGATVFLGIKPTKILDALLANKGRILSKNYLTKKVYGYNHNIKSNVIEVHMITLRRALGRKFISCVKDEGYVIAA